MPGNPLPYLKTSRPGDWLVPLVLAAVVVAANRQSFLLFHTLAELATVVVAVTAFVVAWHSHPFSRNDYLMYLGCGYFWVGTLDLVHALLYRGMSVYPDVTGANPATQFWVATRLLEALLLLSAPWFLTHPLRRRAAFLGWGAVAVTVYLGIRQGLFPDAYLEGRGLTVFKIGAEYLIVGLLAGAMAHLWRRRALVDRRILELVLAANTCTMVAELAFTFYVGVYDLSNLVGHVCKLFAFWLIYRALVEFTLTEPFRVLARTAGSYDAVPHPILVLDRAGRVRGANVAACTAAGLSREALLGRPCHELAHPPELPPERCPVCTALARGDPLAGVDLDFPREGRHLEITLSPVQTLGEPAGMVHVAHDVTARHRAEAALREREAELLAHREHLEALVAERTGALQDADRRKDQFLAMLGHELRNPLAPIRNAAELLRVGERLPPERLRWAADLLGRQVGHMTRLVDDLLDVSRITRGKIELQRRPLDLAEAVARALEQARPLIESQGHTLDLSLPRAPLTVEADPVRLAQILGNLLTNAAKYTDPGGRMGLAVSEEDGWVAIRVWDTGIGIDPALLPRVFDLFIQAEQGLDRARGGLGLGLTLVHNLVEMHGGRVEAASPGPGRGSTFTVRLPLWQAPPLATLPAAPRASVGTGRRILVVDDNPDVADSFALLLEALGHRVDVVHDGESALEAVPRLSPEVVFLDIGLPGIDGYETARRLRRDPALAGLCLVAVTGYGGPEDLARTRHAGFDRHILKPVSLEALEAFL